MKLNKLIPKLLEKKRSTKLHAITGGHLGRFTQFCIPSDNCYTKWTFVEHGSLHICRLLLRRKKKKKGRSEKQIRSRIDASYEFEMFFLSCEILLNKDTSLSL